MLSDIDYIEYRQRVIETFDVYDLVDFLGLKVEDWLDNTTEWEYNKDLQIATGMIEDNDSDE